MNAEFIKKFENTYRKDMMIMGSGLALAIAFCVYQFYLSHFGAALIFAFFSFVSSIILIMYHTLHRKTQRLFDQSDKMIDELLKQLEKDGKI